MAFLLQVPVYILIFCYIISILPLLIIFGCYFCIVARLAVIYLVKFVGLKIIGWLFNMRHAADSYIFIVFIINKVIGIFSFAISCIACLY